jgi:ABC-type polysaccharide/polyol phosphate transport system ATPase subunit
LILDEVFDGADKEFQGKISERVLEMIEKSGAVIFVSHSDDQIRKACNRVIVIDDHQIKFDGEVEEGLKFYNQKLNLTN